MEDHPDSRKYLRLFLKMKGHTVREAKTLAEAKALFEEEEPQVLISDIGLPDGDGSDILRRVKVKGPLYAIAVSGFGAAADVQKSTEAGFRRHLVKPFLPETLDAYLVEAAESGRGE